MKNVIIIILLLLSPLSQASENIDISNLSFKKSVNPNTPIIIYGNIENLSDKLEYLLRIEVIDHPELKITINKTIIEQNIARIIKIDRLAIPTHSTIKLSPLGIYLLMNNTISEVIHGENSLFAPRTCDHLLRPEVCTVYQSLPEELPDIRVKIKFIFAHSEIIKEVYISAPY